MEIGLEIALPVGAFVLLMGCCIYYCCCRKSSDALLDTDNGMPEVREGNGVRPPTASAARLSACLCHW
jgi:hypothetical protein